jgi:hypothetical protein
VGRVQPESERKGKEQSKGKEAAGKIEPPAVKTPAPAAAQQKAEPRPAANGKHWLDVNSEVTRFWGEVKALGVAANGVPRLVGDLRQLATVDEAVERVKAALQKEQVAA